MTKALTCLLIWSWVVPREALAEGLRAYEFPGKVSYRIEFRAKPESSDLQDRMVVYRNRKVLLDKSAYRFYLVDPKAAVPNLGLEEDEHAKIFDLTGNGIKDVIIGDWSGGAHCCYTYDIYELDGRFSHLWHFSARNGHMLTMNQQAPNKLPRLIVEDDTFRDWRSHVFDMPAIAVFWQGKRFVCDEEKTRALNSIKVTPKLLHDLQNEHDKGSLEPGYNLLVRLYYSGNAKEARRLMSDFVSESETAQQLHTDFVKRLAESKFFKEIKRMNGGTL